MASGVPPATQWHPNLNADSPAGVASRIDANLAAIQTLKTLNGRPATADEQQILAQYSGWGGLSAVFDTRKPDYSARREHLQQLLSQDEYKAARRSVINAHYTHPAYVQAIWDNLSDYGFDSGEVLEPGCGVGTFIGLAPENTRMTGVELDAVSAGIAQALYPQATIRNEGYETTPTPQLFDAAVGNVPFGDIKLYDPASNPGDHSIHNHFIIKAISQTKPGGVVAVLTSRYTLDAANPAARRDMFERADLLSAVRLPTGAHSRIAHTEAVTDVLVFRVRKDGEQPQPFEWEHSTGVDIDGDTVRINDYFHQHRDHVLGTLHVDHGMYNSRQLNVKFSDQSQPTPQQIAEDLHSFLNADLQVARQHKRLTYSPEQVGELPAIANAPKAREVGSIRRNGDTFETLTHVGWDTLKVPKTQHEELAALLDLRDSARALVEAEAASATDTPQLAQLRQQLRAHYDAYVDTYGAINRAERKTYRNARDEEVFREKRPPVMKLFDKDPFSALAKAVEIYDADAEVAQRAPIQHARQVFAKYTPKGADDPTDALHICIEQRGEIDLDYIGYLLGDTDTARVRESLGTLIFDLPGGQYATRAEYLSGNVRRKLKTAQILAETDPRYQPNVDALQEVIPPDLTPIDISVEPGAAWISPTYHQQFIRYLVEQYSIEMAHDPINGWGIKGTSNFGILQTAKWGTPRMGATQIFQNLCNNAPIRVFDEDLETGTKHLNPVATEAAQGKAEAIRDEFVKWVWADADRAKDLLAIYNERFNAHVGRSYDQEGQALRLPGLARTFTLHDHQKTAIARMIAEPTTGLFHEVGAGKTLEMVAGVMEQKRLGLIQKPMVIVPNHMLAQFEREWLQAYPQAKILAADVNDITNKSGRGDFMARVTTSNWDAVICTQNAFERIPVDPVTLEKYMSKQITELENWLGTAKDAERYSVSRAEKTLERMKNTLEKRLAKLQDNTDVGLTFDKLGVDYLVVDEAHYYKNLSARTRTQGIIATQTSQRAQDLDMKLTYLRETYGPRCATFATATPIANTMGEMWVMTHYLRPDLLEEAGLDTFDQWAKTFTEITSNVEATASGALKVRQRPAKFQNLPELMQMWTAFGDVKTRDQLDLPTPDIVADKDGNAVPEVVNVDAGHAIDQFQKRIMDRADMIQNRAVPPHIDNWLTLSSDGKAMATDYRLISEKSRERALEGVDLPLDYQKVDAAAERIAEIYEQTKDNTYLDELGQTSDTKGALQLVFLDQGTPNARDSEKWNLYDDLKEKLVERGIPAEQIAYTHDASTTVEKDRIFAKARTGAISVLIGSTEKMGTGANMQTRAVALHHLNAPWRPADLAQREGRIIRQGNQNSEVQVLRYVTERSFDTYMWQTLERKASFINQVMRGEYTGREAEDLSPEEASYAQVKAIASGNPLLLEEAQIQNQLRTYTRRSQAWESNSHLLNRQIHQWNYALEALTRNKDIFAQVAQNIVPTKGDAFKSTINGTTYTKRPDFAKALKDLLRPDFETAMKYGHGLQYHRYRYKGFDQTPRISIGNTDFIVGLASTKDLDGQIGFVFAIDHPNAPGQPIDDDHCVSVTLKDIANERTSVAVRLENHVQAVFSKVENTDDKITQITAEKKRAQHEIEQGNPWKEKVAQTKDELKQIRDKIAAWEIDHADAQPRQTPDTAPMGTIPAHVARIGRQTTNFNPPTHAPTTQVNTPTTLSHTPRNGMTR